MDRPIRRAPRDLESVSQAMRTLGQLRQALDDILRDAQHQIRHIEAQAQRLCAPLRRRARSLEQGLEQFCASRPELLGARQRLDLPAGSLGFSTRRTLRPLPGQTWSTITPRLAAADLPPVPDSPAGASPHALAALPESQLRGLGIAAATHTTFWCRPKPARGE